MNEHAPHCVGQVMIHLPPKRLRATYTSEYGTDGMARSVRYARDAQLSAQDRLYEDPAGALQEIITMNGEWLWAFMLFIDWVNDYD